MIKPDYYAGQDGKDLFDRFEDGLLPREETIGFYKGNIIKYVTRFEQKNGVEDLEKAVTYLERLKKLCEPTPVVYKPNPEPGQKDKPLQ